MANLTHNLRSLLKKDNEFCWNESHSKYFKAIIRTLCESKKLLRYYRPDLDLYLKTDASGVAIGMALLQSEENEKKSLYPIAYGGKTLTSDETRHTNIERELLGVVGALEKLHYFTFGRPVTVLTDHKPLISISKKALVNAPPRLQRLLLRLNNYNATLTWIPGKELVFADHLSRNIAGEKSKVPACEDLELKVEDVYLNASDEKRLSLAKEIDKDEMLVALKSQIVKGWLDKSDECPTNLREYWNYRDELSILNGLVLKGTRIVIPNQCRDELLKQLHEGHFGIDRTKLQTRDSVYWPSINKDVETLIKTCETCQENSKRNAKDPVLAREIPLVPWTLLEMGLFTLDDHTFLLVFDATSQFPVLRILTNETCRAVMNSLKGVYRNFGLPRRD